MDLNFLKKYVDGERCLDDSVLEIDSDLTNICWLPIPHLKIVPDDWELFWKLWNDFKNPMSNKKDQSTIWDGLCIWKSPLLPDHEVYHSMFPLKITDWSHHFPKMFEKIFSSMPYEEIWKVTIATNLKRVPIHVDPPRVSFNTNLNRSGVIFPWPNTLRILLHDENVKPTFFLSKWPKNLIDKGLIKDQMDLTEWYSTKEPENHEKCYVQLPNNTNSFLFSNGEYMHGADFFGPTKVLLLVWGNPKRSAWKEKLRSILKEFPEYKNICRF